MKVCVVEGCERSEKKMSRGMCNAHYIRHRTNSPLQGPIRRYQPGVWGPWYVDSTHGYVLRSRKVQGKTEQQRQHREVMKDILGRELFSHEEVHHINGDKTDNRPENLELWSTSQPKGQRVEDKIAWAESLLREYGRLR